ncbi:MAG: hypothetical protein HY884_06150 [Deltaproteobacteria bacterium]|nr:hypothetical protein [Deltaproteobacteria bacterium]
MYPRSVIFIRRDNIGDLVCTTPAFRAVRTHLPQCRIAVLVNSYNADVIADNPDVDDIYVYGKWKHSAGRTRLGVWMENLDVIREIRRQRFDVSIGCGCVYSARLARYAFFTGGRTRICPTPGGRKTFFINCPVPEPDAPIHEVEAMMRLIEPLGVTGPAPAPCVRPDAVEAAKVLKMLEAAGVKDRKNQIAFHISSRRPQNRWPIESFHALGDLISAKHGFPIMLLWSPGKGDNPLHPGDDENAQRLCVSMKNKPIPYRTEGLKGLIAALSAASVVVCCDGGAMHIAAALGKPVLTVWGGTDARRWSPRGAAHVILKNGADASSVTPLEAFSAFNRLIMGDSH